MGKKAIKKIILVLFAGLATLGVLANDLLPVSAPILAVELGRSEAFINVDEYVSPNPVSPVHEPSEGKTANRADDSSSSLSGLIPAAEETKEPVAVERELETKSNTNEPVHETENRIPNRSVSFTSDWLEFSSSMIEKLNFSPGEAASYFAERHASVSVVEALAAPGSESATRAFVSREPLFPALKASRPLLFGKIVNRKLLSQPILRPVLSSLPKFNPETVPASKDEVGGEYTGMVKHQAKTPQVFSTAGLHASSPRLPGKTEKHLHFFPILEGPDAIDLTVVPRVAPKAIAISVPTTISTIRHRSTPQQVFDFASLRESSSIVDRPSAIDLNVFPRLAMRSDRAEISSVPSISVKPQPMFAFTASSTSSPILEGPNAIDLTVSPRSAYEAAAISVPTTISSVRHRSTSPILEGPNAIDLTVSPRSAYEAAAISVPTTISTVRHRSTSPILEGPNAIDLTVFPRSAYGAVAIRVPTTISTVRHRSTSPILEGANAIDLSVSPRSAYGAIAISVPTTTSMVRHRSSSPILEGPNAIDLTVSPRSAYGAVAISVPTTISTVRHRSTPQQIFDFASQRESYSIVDRTSAIDLNVFPRFATKPPAPLPVAVPYSIVSNDTRTAPVAAVHRPVPVLIGGQTAFSEAMLRPLESAAHQSNVSIADSFVASNRGPSAGSFANDLSALSAELENAKPPTALLITGQPGFSTEMLKPLNANRVQAKPFNVSTPLRSGSSSGTPSQVAGYCDAGFVGEPIRFSQTVELKLEDLLNQLNARFGINFILGQNVGKIPLNVKAGSIPWNILLKSQLFVSGVRARCINPTTIELVLNRDLPTLQDEGAVTTKFVKLKFFQRTSGGTVDLANRSQGGQNGGQGGCGGSGGGQSSGGQSGGSSSGGGGGQMGQTAGQLGNNRFDKLILEIEKILGIRPMVEGGSGGRSSNSETEELRTNRFVTQIPGRNILVIRASDEEHELIDQIIARADRPPFQVVIKALVYSANQDRLQDVGVQTSITGGNNRTFGGIFGDTSGPGTLFDFSTIIGTFEFNVQVHALQQNGVISVKSRPFSTVIDGLCTTLNVGRELPIVIDSTLGGQGDVVFVNAANRLAVTPYVIDDENGNPVAVTLELSLDANDVDSSVTTNGVPAISRRSIQTQLLLGEDKTAILGGFTIDQDSKTIRKTPGLGNIPIIGELFKRRIRDTRISRLYFAISASIIPYPEAIAPVVVPGATTDPQTITQEMKKRAEEAEALPKKKKDN